MKFTIENGCFAYDASRTILQDVCVQLDGAEILTVLGSNGVGKTTLMKCMLGLLKWTSGRSCADGEDVRRIPHAQLWKRIG